MDKYVSGKICWILVVTFELKLKTDFKCNAQVYMNSGKKLFQNIKWMMQRNKKWLIKMNLVKK